MELIRFGDKTMNSVFPILSGINFLPPARPGDVGVILALSTSSANIKSLLSIFFVYFPVQSTSSLRTFEVVPPHSYFPYSNQFSKAKWGFKKATFLNQSYQPLQDKDPSPSQSLPDYMIWLSSTTFISPCTVLIFDLEASANRPSESQTHNVLFKCRALAHTVGLGYSSC